MKKKLNYNQTTIHVVRCFLQLFQSLITLCVSLEGSTTLDSSRSFIFFILCKKLGKDAQNIGRSSWDWHKIIMELKINYVQVIKRYILRISNLRLENKAVATLRCNKKNKERMLFQNFRVKHPRTVGYVYISTTTLSIKASHPQWNVQNYTPAFPPWCCTHKLIHLDLFIISLSDCARIIFRTR